MLKVAKKLSRASACNDGLSSKFCLVLGLQWGNEGKRKLLNKLCVDYDYSCRFNGGTLSEPSKNQRDRQLTQININSYARISQIMRESTLNLLAFMLENL